MSNEREAAVTLKGNPITLVGPELKVGDKAPDFVCDQGLAPTISLSDMVGKVKIFNVLLSISYFYLRFIAIRFMINALGN